MTDKTQILTVRLPKEVKEGYKGVDMRTLLTSVYDMWRLGVIDIVDSEIVLPEREEIQSERFIDDP